jgi:putative flippase GtrA
MNHLSLRLESYLKKTSKLASWIGLFLRSHETFLRFILIGIINTVVGLTVIFIFKNGLHVSYWLATFAVNTLGAVGSFLLN